MIQPAGRPPSVSLPVADVARTLVAALGTTNVALCCAPDTKSVRRWASGERAPSADRERVLRFLLTLVHDMQSRMLDEEIRNWLTTYNFELSDTPSLLLRDQSLDDVSKRIVDAAQRFMEIFYAS